MITKEFKILTAVSILCWVLLTSSTYSVDLIHVNENTQAVKAFEIQVMNLSSFPKDLRFNEGLKAIHNTQNNSWLIRTATTYSTYSEAQKALAKYKQQYPDAFILNVLVYKANTSALKQDNTRIDADTTRVQEKRLEKLKKADSIYTVEHPAPTVPYDYTIPKKEEVKEQKDLKGKKKEGQPKKETDRKNGFPLPVR